MPLRALRNSDIPSLAAWLPAVASASGFDRWVDAQTLSNAIGNDNALLYTDDAGQAFVAFALNTPKRNAAAVDFIAVAPERRRLGIGGRAAIALERRLSKTTRQIYVAVPSSTGLALYFWLRLGYRPLMRPDWPAPLDGASTWMLRELR